MQNIGKTKKEVFLSIVFPCLNEEESVGVCVTDAINQIKKLSINGEVLVSDNGSTDNSVQMARKAGARVVFEKRKGYGSAYIRGISEAKGKYVIMADSDNTYDLSAIPDFLKKLRRGYEFVIGSRLKGEIEKGAMPPLHRYVGTPVISFLLNRIFRTSFSDSQCGMRGFTKEAFVKMHLRSPGMEFASEMIVRASRLGLKSVEVPINYKKRSGESKLSTLRDGWRHLRFILLYSPTFLFIIPGLVSFFVGLFFLILLFFGPIRISNSLFLDIHPMFLASLLSIAGFDFIALGIFSKIYAVSSRLEEGDKVIGWFNKNISLEKIILLGSILIIMGIVILGFIFTEWVRNDFRNIFEIRRSILSITLLIIGIQVIFYGFFLSILRIKDDTD